MVSNLIKQVFCCFVLFENLFNYCPLLEKFIIRKISNQIPCVTIALFLGPWSDQAGRKPLILVPYIGYFLFCVAMLFNVYFFDELYVEFLWFENISALCGSYVIFLIGCYGFLADTTSPETR